MAQWLRGSTRNQRPEFESKNIEWLALASLWTQSSTNKPLQKNIIWNHRSWNRITSRRLNKKSETGANEFLIEKRLTPPKKIIGLKHFGEETWDEQVYFWWIAQFFPWMWALVTFPVILTLIKLSEKWKGLNRANRTLLPKSHYKIRSPSSGRWFYIRHLQLLISQGLLKADTDIELIKSSFNLLTKKYFDDINKA